MSTPLSYDQIISACRKWGIDLALFPGSRNLCRCHSGSHDKGGRQIRAFSDVNGFMNHITAGTSSNILSYITNVIVSDPSLPLKSQFVIDPTGKVWLISAGRCNHAGKISARALAMSRSDSWPLTGYTDARGGSIDGNAHYYGVEVMARSSMNPAQYRSMILLNAAISDAHGWTGQGTCGHGEASNQRSYSDPNLNMGQVRRDVMARIKAGPQTGGKIASGTGSVTSSIKSAAKSVAPAPKRTVDLTKLLAAIDSGTYSEHVRLVQQTLNRSGNWRTAGLSAPLSVDGIWGPRDTAAMAAYQRALGFRGKDADGRPGRTSTTKLGQWRSSYATIESGR